MRARHSPCSRMLYRPVASRSHCTMLAHPHDRVDRRLALVARLVARPQPDHGEAPVAREAVGDHRAVARLEDVQRQHRVREERRGPEAGRSAARPGPPSADASATIGRGAERGHRVHARDHGRGRCSRNAWAWAESGRPTVIGTPASPPSRVSISSGIWPSSGTPNSSATLLPAALAEDGVAAAGVGRHEVAHVLDDAQDRHVELPEHRRAPCARRAAPRPAASSP